MRILDIDMDYFLKDIPSECPNGRLEEEYIETWKEQEVIQFLEKNLGLSKKHRIPGCIIEKHNKAINFWDDLIAKNKLKIPFEVIHIDSHSDLSPNIMAYGLRYYREDSRLGHYWKTIETKKEDREKLAIMNNYPTEGDYLLYAIAFGWIKHLIYYTNPSYVCPDYPDEIFVELNGDEDAKDNFCSVIQLKEDEKMIPFNFNKRIESIKPFGKYDFIVFAQSPNYTPESLDFVIDIMKEYIEVIFTDMDI